MPLLVFFVRSDSIVFSSCDDLFTAVEIRIVFSLCIVFEFSGERLFFSLKHTGELHILYWREKRWSLKRPLQTTTLTPLRLSLGGESRSAQGAAAPRGIFVDHRIPLHGRGDQPYSLLLFGSIWLQGRSYMCEPKEIKTSVKDMPKSRKKRKSKDRKKDKNISYLMI